MSDTQRVVASLCGKSVPPHSDARLNMTVAVPKRYFVAGETELNALRRYLEDEKGDAPERPTTSSNLVEPDLEPDMDVFEEVESR